MAHLLFVCEGNVCRSPFAERLMQKMLAGVPYPHVTVSSAGLTPMEGWGIAEPTAALIESFGGSSLGHSARLIQAGDVEIAKLVLTATRAQRARTVLLHPRAVQYTFTIRQLGHVLAKAFPHGPPVPLPGTPPEERLEAVSELAHVHVGLSAGLEDLSDVVDPFTKRPAVHARAAAQMLPALNLLARSLGGTPVEIPSRLVAAGAAREHRRRGRRRAG